MKMSTKAVSGRFETNQFALHPFTVMIGKIDVSLDQIPFISDINLYIPIYKV